MCPIVSRRSLLNCSTSFNQTWYGGVLSWGRVLCRKKMVHYLLCPGHSQGLYNQNMTMSTVSSKLLVHLQPNMVWQYSIISQSVLWKHLVTAFRAKVTAKVQNVSDRLSGWYLLIYRTFCYQTYSSTEHFVTKLLMMMQHHEPEYHVEEKKKACYLQGQSHSQDSYEQNMTLSAIFSELLILRQPNLVRWYIIISHSVLWKNWITASKVKVAMKHQNVSVYPGNIA